MKKVKFPKLRKFFKGKGFATALVLSISAVGASAYIAYNATVNRLSEEGDAFNQDAAIVGNPQEGIARTPETTTAAAEANSPATSENDENASNSGRVPPSENCEETNPSSPRGNVGENAEGEICMDCCYAEETNHFVRPEIPRVMPVTGETIKPFSNGELVRSNTLGVWRTHDAVDIGAPLGTEVVAAQRGVVSEVYTNAMWGVCIIIDHGDGIFSSYMSLDKAVKVEIGQEVEAGTPIGLVGNTAEAEIACPPSLHFAVMINDVWVDPIAFIEGTLE
ncbi:MAG: M23 family metallopeptidase [Oscillospiraceae bacterium]|nr:M23 family metallopeptidase [Oscillospiraceae bacterium]